MGVFYGEEGMGEGAKQLYEAGIRSIKNCFGGKDIKTQNKKLRNLKGKEPTPELTPQ